MKRILPILSAVSLIAFTSSSFAITAFQARAIAEKMLNDQAKGKLVKVIGKRAEGPEPETWSFIFFDPYADQQGRYITVTGKAVSKITDGYSEMEDLRFAAYKEEEILPKGLLKVDSTQALSSVKKTASLQDIKLTSVAYKLAKESKGAVAPVWKLTLFAEKNGRELEIGQAKVSAETGRVMDLKIYREKLK